MFSSRVNILLFLALGVLLSFRVESLELVAEQEADEDNEIEGGGCFAHDGKHRVGDKWPGPIGECTIYTCTGDETYSALTCPAFQILPESGCYKTKLNLTVQYPHCCPRAVCPDHPPTIQTLTLPSSSSSSSSSEEDGKSSSSESKMKEE